MTSIVFDRVEFHYQDPFQDVFAALDLTIETAWRTALVGRNGRGKTTLLRLIARELQPTGGHLEGPVVARLFPPDPGDPWRATRDVVRAAIAPFDEWRREMAELAVAAASGRAGDDVAGVASGRVAGDDGPIASAQSAVDDAAIARWGELEARFAAA